MLLFFFSKIDWIKIEYIIPVISNEFFFFSYFWVSSDEEFNLYQLTKIIFAHSLLVYTHDDLIFVIPTIKTKDKWY